jgi:ubiquinone/menaquinone biosynthesis C-methylase UbiE
MAQLRVSDVDELKARSRVAWAAGDHDRIADLIWPVGEVVVEAAAVEPWMDVLDGAAGTGSVAVSAAARDAKVVASDLTSQMFDDGRRRAEQAAVEIAPDR